MARQRSSLLRLCIAVGLSAAMMLDSQQQVSAQLWLPTVYNPWAPSKGSGKNDSISATPLGVSSAQSLASKVTEATTPKDHEVKDLPGLPDSFKQQQYAGLITVDEKNNGNLFYWYIESGSKNPADDPVIFWLNGGPGCSSLFGLLTENGPFRVNDNNTLEINEYSWHKLGHTVFVDQPVGTGLATVSNQGYPTSLTAVTEQFYTFIQKFFRLHTDLTIKDGGKVKTRKVVFTGESFAGRYIPEFTTYILEQNAKNDAGNIHIDVQSLALGDPYIHPADQLAVSEYAYSLGYLSMPEREAMEVLETECSDLLEGRKHYTKRDELDNCYWPSSLATQQYTPGTHLDIYDVRRFVSLNSPSEPFEKYLSEESVLKALNVAGMSNLYQQCNDDVYESLNMELFASSLDKLDGLLKGGMKVLIYTGQYDMIVDHISLEKVLNKLTWKGSAEFAQAPRKAFVFDSRNFENTTVAGFGRTADVLTYLLVFGAGHMVPTNQPVAAYKMMLRHLSGETIATVDSIDLNQFGITPPTKGGSDSASTTPSGSGTTSGAHYSAGTTAIISVASSIAGILLGALLGVYFGMKRGKKQSQDALQQDLMKLESTPPAGAGV